VGISPPEVEIEERVSGAATPMVREIPARPLLELFLFFGSRAAFGGFLLLSSIYCLLVSVPFSYFGFIQHPLLAWLPGFVKLHGTLYCILLAAVSITLIPDLADRSRQRSSGAFIAINGASGVYLWATGALARVQLDFMSYWWSILFLFPVIWLSAVDLTAAGSGLWAQRRNRGTVPQGMIAAVIVSIAFSATSIARALHGGLIGGTQALRDFGTSLCFHFVIFAACGLILSFLGLLSRLAPQPGLFDFILSRAFLWLLLAQMLRMMVLPAISLEGIWANIFAAAVSFAIVLAASAFAAKWSTPTFAGRIRSRRNQFAVWKLAVAGALAIAAAYAIPTFLGPTDWDFVLQRITVVGVWLAVFQIVRWSDIQIGGRSAALAVAATLIATGILFAHYARSALYTADPTPMSEALETYAGLDISFKTAYEILSRPMDDAAYREFYKFLKQNTNIDGNGIAGPADVRLVSDLAATAGVKPNIFFFVIDSLRQDYVSAYNSKVNFTPEIGKFAQDSVVLKNAFTRYGGTALSEPAIWVGAMQLHKQYITPFAPMNNLQKLLETDGYHSYISVDPIVAMMLAPSSSITPLDTETKSWGDLDFVSTLEELEARIRTRSDQKPIFAYTQPQNVHTLTLERSKIKGGRKAVSEYELRRMDAAFGEFIGALKKNGLYDNSIIILTADHGECYGEFGRYGHSDYLFPEIIRVPMIIHLPPKMRQRFVWDEKQVAFTIDLTPSLYYLLGHQPIVNDELFGRPLFTHSLQEQSAYSRSRYLLVSSYAPVYAVLGGNAESLFIADAVNSRNYYYNLTDDPHGTENHVTAQLIDQNDAWIRHEIDLIDTLYHWHAK
jgi:Sulfatase